MRDIYLMIHLGCCEDTYLKMQVTSVNVGLVVLIHTYLTFRFYNLLSANLTFS